MNLNYHVGWKEINTLKDNSKLIGNILLLAIAIEYIFFVHFALLLKGL